MMNNNQEKILLTPEGLEKIKKEYEELTTKRRKEIAQRIQEAREQEAAKVEKTNSEPIKCLNQELTLNQRQK